jgi:esterase/lipase superfamily enzyme
LGAPSICGRFSTYNLFPGVALSGIYDMRDSMDGIYDDTFYFNNPVD